MNNSLLSQVFHSCNWVRTNEHVNSKKLFQTRIKKINKHKRKISWKLVTIQYTLYICLSLLLLVAKIAVADQIPTPPPPTPPDLMLPWDCKDRISLFNWLIFLMNRALNFAPWWEGVWGRSNLPQVQQSSLNQILDRLNKKFLDPLLNCHLELHIFFKHFWGGAYLIPRNASTGARFLEDWLVVTGRYTAFSNNKKMVTIRLHRELEQKVVKVQHMKLEVLRLKTKNNMNFQPE